ncbi:MAG: alpha/beta hydrolase [Ilumatobacteraceae bacterium]
MRRSTAARLAWRGFSIVFASVGYGETRWLIDIVLVHGTTQAPIGWSRLVDALERFGHSCHVVDMCSVPSDLSASGFARAVAGQVNVLRPIVVAHSGSGLLLGAITEVLDAHHQVFLAASVPDGRHSLMDEVRDHAAEMFNPAWLGKDPVGDLSVAREFLFHDCDEETTEWALTTLRLFHPSTVYEEVVPLDTKTPATVIVPSEDRTICADWIETTAVQRLGVTATVIGGGHCPHVSQPDEIAAIIDGIVTRESDHWTCRHRD